MKKYLLIPFFMALITACSSGGPNPTVTIDTRLGSFEVEIFQDKTPELAKNFLYFAKEGKYEGVPFHRVIKGFMIQGGDFENKNGTGGYSYKGPGTELEHEGSLSNLRGTLSMANKGKSTNGSQFFVNLVDNTYLDGKHPVFGKVIKGMEIVDKIAEVETGSNDRPKEEVAMKRLTVTEK